MFGFVLALLPVSSALGVDYAAGFVNPADLGQRPGIRIVLGGFSGVYEQTREAILYDNFGNFTGWIPVSRIRLWEGPQPWIGVAYESEGRGIAFQVQPEVFSFSGDREKVYAPDYTLIQDLEQHTRTFIHRYVLSGGGTWGTFRAGLEMAVREGVTVTERVDHLAFTRTETRSGYRGYDLAVGAAYLRHPIRVDGYLMAPLSEEGGELPLVMVAGVEALGAQAYPTHLRISYRQERVAGSRTTEEIRLATRQAILDRYLLGLAASGVRDNTWTPVLSFITGYQQSFYGDLSVVVGADARIFPRREAGTERIAGSLTRIYAYLVFRL